MIVRAALAALALLVTSPGARSEEAVDLELVLAIDSSSSVDEQEWALQRQGYAEAFRDRRVQAAIVSGPNARIAVAVVVWADATRPRWDSGWFVLAGPEDGERFAAFMSGLPREPLGGTGIGMGLAAAIRKLDRNGLTAPRQVVDVSGDGRETPPRETVVLIGMAQAMAAARGVTVNGLAIVNEDPALATWYRDNVMSGRGAFVIAAADYEDFARAIVEKLVREIEHQERLTRR
ncbi:MAG TPA: DUF1194 domain-containing protein [Propylenella sp.]